MQMVGGNQECVCVLQRKSKSSDSTIASSSCCCCCCSSKPWNLRNPSLLTKPPTNNNLEQPQTPHSSTKPCATQLSKPQPQKPNLKPGKPWMTTDSAAKTLTTSNSKSSHHTQPLKKTSTHIHTHTHTRTRTQTETRARTHTNTRRHRQAHKSRLLNSKHRLVRIRKLQNLGSWETRAKLWISEISVKTKLHCSRFQNHEKGAKKQKKQQ